MNFDNMPELNYKYGYFITLGAMAFIASSFAIYFYRKGWFN
jgi:magnesium transporter